MVSSVLTFDRIYLGDIDTCKSSVLSFVVVVYVYVLAKRSVNTYSFWINVAYTYMFSINTHHEKRL